MKDAQSVCCWIPTVVAHLFGCCEPLHCCGDTGQRLPTPAPTARPACVDQHSDCGSLKARLESKGFSCVADLGKILNNASYAGKRLVDECCASCGGGGSAPACNASRSAHCDKCITGLGVTLAKCTSYGLDCACSKECTRLGCKIPTWGLVFKTHSRN